MDNKNDAKIISFKELEKEYKNAIKEEKEERKLNIEASYIFHKALKEKDKEKAYELASSAYEINQSKYEYMVYAISKLDDKNRRMREYKALYEEINSLIDAFTLEDALLKIYDESEYNKKRYCDLQYNLAISLIKCEKYQEAYELLEKLLNSKSNYRFKVKYLMLNILLIKKDYQLVIDLYNEEKDCSVLILFPLSYAYLKLNKYKEFVGSIRLISHINPKFSDFINEKLKNINEVEMENIISYDIASIEEIYFALKEFLFLYVNDSEYFKKVKTILD